MIELSHKTVATVTLAPQAELTLVALPGLISWMLSQADVQIHRLDLCIPDERIDYRTDHGTLTFKMLEGPEATRQIAVTCNTLVRGTREIGRQLCFQIINRLIARTAVTAIFWQPTRQTLDPAAFTWHQLADAPQRLAS